MPRALCRLALAALALASPIAAASAAGPNAPADPTAPVAALYAIEQAGRPPLEDPTVRAATLTRGLAALYDKAKAVERATGDVLIDFDAVTNSQGAEVKSYALKVEPRDLTHASVVAVIDPGNWLRNSPRENVIRFDLILVHDRWRIDDIRGITEPKAWSLREIIDYNLRQY